MRTSQDYTDEILTDLLTRIPSIALHSSEDFDTYWEQVGAWLLRLEEADYHRWCIRFVLAIHQSWGIHPDYAAACVRVAVERADAKVGR